MHDEVLVCYHSFQAALSYLFSQSFAHIPNIRMFKLTVGHGDAVCAVRACEANVTKERERERECIDSMRTMVSSFSVSAG